MKLMFLLSGIINVCIFIYTVYFLYKVRFYPCIKEKLGENIHLISWVIALCGITVIHTSYYSFRAIIRGFDYTTESLAIFQVFAWLYAITLFIFHFKTINNE